MKQGFFDLGTGETPELLKSRSVGQKQGCDACGLHRKCKSPKMSPTGKGQMKILLVGEYPTKAVDESGIHFDSKSGNLLKKTLSDLGVKMRRDCRMTYALNCRPEKDPKDTEINECRTRLFQEINEYKPNVIIPLGMAAVSAVIGHRITGRLTGTKRNDFFSEQIPDQDLKCWVCPTYSPAFLTIHEDKKEFYTVTERIWRKDLKDAVELAKSGKKVPIIDYQDHIQITDSLETARNMVKEAIDMADWVTFDYETTGIKPHAPGHEIICTSIGYQGKAVAFPFFKDESFLSLWENLMTNPKIGKVAQKSDFENNWTYNRAGPPQYWPEPYIWDTCIGAHCINNTKPTGLKFQTYVKLGVIGYDDSAHSYITTTKAGQEKGTNSQNKIREAPLKQLLEYCAADAYFEYLLTKWQNTHMSAHKKAGFELMLRGVQALSRIHQNGMKINGEEMHTQNRKFGKILAAYEKRILNSDEVHKWSTTQRKEFNPNSNPQLSKLLYDLLKYDIPDEGKKTDEKALKKIDNEFTQNLLAYRKVDKLKNTYLSQFLNEEVDGVIRPFFNLHKVRTFRSSSDSPNFQNIPKRDKDAKKIRSIIVPSDGNMLIEYDYKSVEVCVSACYHKDPNMIKYILDPTTDMHRDTACDLFFKNKENFTKFERYLAKNGFVFPAFYGSTAPVIAPTIWEQIEPDTMSHLKANGITCFADFKAHVKGIENVFWNERFAVYNEWKQKIYKDYVKKGYVDLHTGFRCYGPMDFTQVTNYPIQGSAFHVLLWTLCQICDKIQDISGKSRMIGQIHDAQVVDAHPGDEKEIDQLVNYWGTEKVREHWDWIVTPLKVEKEKSAVDGNWSEMKECNL